MSKNITSIVHLKLLLNLSRQDKLMYLNAADNQHLPAFKRFFNQQALYRNKMFNEYSFILSNYGIEIEDALLKRPDLRVLMMSSTKKVNGNPFIKSLMNDRHFKDILEQVIKAERTSAHLTTYQKQLEKIKDSIERNELYSLEVKSKSLSSSSLY